MNYPLLSEYIEAIKSAEDNFDELNNLRAVLDENGEPVMSSGNFAVVFKMKDEQTGRLHAVKCFLKEQEGRAEAYRMIAEELEYVNSTFLTPIKYLDKELFVDTNASVETEFPVLLMDWVEGQTLDKYIREYIYDQYELSMLAYQFSRLAMWLMPQPFAHGDLKPDNILVKDDGTLVLVDYDGMYVPAMKGQKARELGSPDFRHPSRTEEVFDEHIDDFSLASILLSLKAIALQPELLEEYGASDRLLFSEKDYCNLSESKAMDALRPFMQDSELASLYSLFILALSQNNLSQVSFRLFYLNRPQASTLPYISDYCSIRIEDSHGYEVDKYGAIYSHDHKILLRLPYDVIQYNVEEGTEIIATGAFDHFDVVAGGGAVDIFESYLEYLYLPTSVKYITESAFLEDGRRIKEIRVANNPNYYKHYLPTWANKIVKAQPYSDILTHSKSVYDIFGAEYSQDGKTLISLYWLSPDVTKYEIKKGVKNIKFGAAQLAKNIHEIVVPSGVEYIEDSAFVNSSLSSIKLPLTLRPIESDIFYGCGKLEKIFIPEGTKVVYEEMLPSYKDKLIEEIDNNDYSAKIDKVDLDNTWIDEYGVVYSSDRKRLLKAPNDIKVYYIPKGTKIICDSAFCRNERLTSLTIPASVSKIGCNAFFRCNNLSSIVIDKGNNNYDSRENCNAIIETRSNTLLRGCTATIIPNSVSKIGDSAFAGCFWLLSMVIPKSVVEISNNAFEDCKWLSIITFYNAVKQISPYAFIGCSRLSSIFVPKGQKTYFETQLPHCVGIIVELKNEWVITEIRPFYKEEILSVTKAEVVSAIAELEDIAHYEYEGFLEEATFPVVLPSKESIFRYNVRFYLSTGGYVYIPLSNKSSLSLGDSLDLNTAKVITLSCVGKNNIQRVIE